jgi:LPXTG-motif cell wall-anchored protein
MHKQHSTPHTPAPLPGEYSFEPAQNLNVHIPRTGDESHMFFMLIIMILAAILAGGLALKLNKTKEWR